MLWRNLLVNGRCFLFFLLVVRLLVQAGVAFQTFSLVYFEVVVVGLDGELGEVELARLVHGRAAPGHLRNADRA